MESGTLAVINGGKLQVGDTPAANDLLVASNMIISGAGSSVTVNGFTGIGIFGPATLSISNGGVLNSQGGAEIDSILGTPTATVTGPGSTWNVGGLGLRVGGGSIGGPGMLTISNGGVVNTNVTFIGDSADGSSTVLVTGTGSRLTATTGLSIGGEDCGCGPLVGTLTIADGGVVEAADTRILANSTLRLGIGGLGGTLITPTLRNDGTIVANFTDTVTLAAHISGSGTLSKAGTGTLILTGNNTYSGGTTITGGTLQLGNGGTSGSIAGNVTDNGTFAINRSDTVTFGGVISGTGTFAQIGPGTTILTAINTYSGGTAIDGRRARGGGRRQSRRRRGRPCLRRRHAAIPLRASPPTALSRSAPVAAPSTPTAIAPHSAARSPAPATLTKIGTGTLTLSGASTLLGRDRRSMPARYGWRDQCLRAREARSRSGPAPRSTSRASTRPSARSPAPAP